jgi:hypothetical protein
VLLWEPDGVIARANPDRAHIGVAVAEAVEHERNATIGDQGGAGSIRAEFYVKGLSITASAGDERQLAIITSLSRWRSGPPRMAQVGHDKLREII